MQLLDRSPRSASIADRLIDAVGRLPFNGWWLYVVVGVVGLSWVAVGRWLSGAAPVGELDVGALAPVAYFLIALALMQHLEAVAARAVR